ncbi:Rrf2 family transcriptional regulator [Rathayibacter tanaceti]|uniref:Transcriptional regulator n=2 Tax=Rathayibacter tanaceti TaxID=1671680 RepID=A0A166IG20_9MICO|nr:Rrf2 family transcriptional regulator [Rathayibacter tanaceti]KZX22326.1 putative HTH-type transcriptional regulator YwnA [Rathayibacter tanaceti]QHC56148.1 transcriptional regulator [Rathayibacter tanaceti]TCO36988.1 Rrf2 family protein [Rathayibacter tanaceti]
MPGANTQFSIAAHVLAAIALYDGTFTSEHLAGSVNTNPVFVKRILVKLSKANLVVSRVGKSGGYALARRPEMISLLEVHSAVTTPEPFAIHSYPERQDCVVSRNIKDVLGDLRSEAQTVLEGELRRTSLADVVSKIRAQSI